jgi:outer membrane protein assembly factor BamB
MQDIKEQQRWQSPGSRPQPLTFDGTSLWTGSWDTDTIYQIDPRNGTVLQEIAAPGKPYGLAFLNKELRAVVSIGDDDDRYFYRLAPESGFDLGSKTACPDYTGSHLASDGALLQMEVSKARFRCLAVSEAWAFAQGLCT